MWNEICGYENSHKHSFFSLLDGYASVEEYAEYSKSINQDYLCITDHGIMGAVPRQIAACDKHGLHPIFGCELFTNPLQVAMTTAEERKKFYQELNEAQKIRYRKNNHLLAIAYTDEGYSNLVRLSSWGYLFGIGGFPQRPRVNYDVIEKHKKGIVFTSCCYASEIGWTFDTQGADAAEDVLREMIARFGSDYRLAIMMLDFVKQRAYNEFIIKMHFKYGIPIVLESDTHYCKKEDSEMQRYMIMQQTGRTIHDIEKIVAEGGDVFELQDTQLYMKSETEINSFWYSNYRDNIDLDVFKESKRNAVKLCEKAKGVQIDRSNKLPQIPDAEEKLKEEAFRGFKKRNLPRTPQYIGRLMEEYELICRKGFASYFLIQKQFTDTARREAERILGYKASNPVGPGRGCLAPDVMIRIMSSESVVLKPISEVVVGDRVVTHDGTVQAVTNTFRYENSEDLLRFTAYYGDKTGVVLTGDHKVFASRKKRADRNSLGWIEAQHLDVGDWVYTPPCPEGKKYTVVPEVRPRGFDQDVRVVFEDGAYMSRLKTLRKIQSVPFVYDLEVENSHSFLTSSFVVHNSAVGALLCYCLRITDVDPIRHDLLFSRFLSEARGGKTPLYRAPKNVDPVPYPSAA